MEKIIETDWKESSYAGKVCKSCQAHFDITDADMIFYEKIVPTFDGKKFSVPTPTFCPECRFQRRLSFRNERTLYKDQCDLTGKTIISMYAPTSPYKVYDQDVRRWDQRDAISYARDFDFSRSFFEQFNELLIDVPRLAMVNMNSQNSEYCNPWINNRDCYLVFSVRNCEACLYGRRIDDSTTCVDCLSVQDSQNCYSCIQCGNCYACINCINCHDCSDCINCRDLDNKQYYINNKEYSKEEFKKLKDEGIILDPTLWNHDNVLNNFANENCSGNFIRNSRDCVNCYDVYEWHSLHNCEFVKKWTEDCIDTTMCLTTALQREVLSSINQSICISAYSCWNSSFLFYCDSCYNCRDCFGCVGLRDKQYYIFNKEYSKTDYEKLVPKIMEKMKADGDLWEFFPSTISPFWYNETLAQEYFPLTKKEALERWFKRLDYEAPLPQVEKTLKASDLPDIKNVTDDILQQAIICEVSGKPFRIIPQELKFYRKYNIQLPHKHPDVRHSERMQYRR